MVLLVAIVLERLALRTVVLDGLQQPLGQLLQHPVPPTGFSPLALALFRNPVARFESSAFSTSI
ncbi:hypothetical protein [Lentzea xinjiangensis]|uniref:hypothetical protein n=1 Tax=Lentzea xinjiangensis TaxID=402600 RepID=UPI0011604F6E|nr:hypothetical protein [Lentzea xinjiangensis]